MSRNKMANVSEGRRVFEDPLLFFFSSIHFIFYSTLELLKSHYGMSPQFCYLPIIMHMSGWLSLVPGWPLIPIGSISFLATFPFPFTLPISSQNYCGGWGGLEILHLTIDYFLHLESLLTPKHQLHAHLSS